MKWNSSSVWCGNARLSNRRRNLLRSQFGASGCQQKRLNDSFDGRPYPNMPRITHSMSPVCCHSVLGGLYCLVPCAYQGIETPKALEYWTPTTTPRCSTDGSHDSTPTGTTAISPMSLKDRVIETGLPSFATIGIEGIQALGDAGSAEIQGLKSSTGEANHAAGGEPVDISALEALTTYSHTYEIK